MSSAKVTIEQVDDLMKRVEHLTLSKTNIKTKNNDYRSLHCTNFGKGGHSKFQCRFNTKYTRNRTDLNSGKREEQEHYSNDKKSREIKEIEKILRAKLPLKLGEFKKLVSKSEKIFLLLAEIPENFNTWETLKRNDFI